MIIIGIDPGINGALAVIEDKKLVEVIDLPTMSEGKKNKRQINSAQLAKIISAHKKKDNKDICIIVEQVNAMPGQGVTSMFNFGQTFGVIKGITATLEIPIFFVRPSKWKKYFELINASKDASRTKVIEMYPAFSDQLSKKKDVNKADAILIARYYLDTKEQNI